MTDTKGTTLPHRVKAARNGTGLTQAQFADAVQLRIAPRREVGVSDSTAAAAGWRASGDVH